MVGAQKISLAASLGSLSLMLRKAGEASSQYTRRITLERSRRAERRRRAAPSGRQRVATVSVHARRRRSRNTACRSKAANVQRRLDDGRSLAAEDEGDWGMARNRWVGSCDMNRQRKRRGRRHAGALMPRRRMARRRRHARRRRARRRERSIQIARRQAHRDGDASRSASPKTCAPTRASSRSSSAIPRSPTSIPLTDRSLSILGKKIGTTRVSVYGEGKKLIGVFDVEVSYDTSLLGSELAQPLPACAASACPSVNGRIMLSGTAPDGLTRRQGDDRSPSSSARTSSIRSRSLRRSR